MHIFYKIPLILGCIFFMYTVPLAFAKSGEIPFKVAPVLPENQNSDVTGYYDLKVEPNQQQNNYILVENLKNNPITVSITPFNAMTSNNGEIVYDVNVKNDRFVNLKVKLDKYITNDRKIEIPAKASVKVPLKFSLPNINEGRVLGGIHVIADDETINETKIKQNKSTFQIKNQIAYVIGVNLQFPKNVAPKFSFGEARVDMVYGAPKFFIEMKNSAPAVIKELNGTYEVTDYEGKKVLNGSFSSMKMAPNTRFEYPIDWFEGEVKSGTYKLRVTADADGKNVKAEKIFTIKEDKAIEEFNKGVQKVSPETSVPWWIYFILILVVGFIFFIIGRKSNKDKEEDVIKIKKRK